MQVQQQQQQQQQYSGNAIVLYFVLWYNSPTWAYAASSLKFLDHTQLDTHNQPHKIRQTQLDTQNQTNKIRQTKLDTHTQQDSSERVISLSLRSLPTQHSKHKIRTSMPLARFEPATPRMKRLQTCALHCADIGIGSRPVLPSLLLNLLDLMLTGRGFEQVLLKGIMLRKLTYRK